MRLHDIAEATGRDKNVVAVDFGIETEGNYWLKEVDDGAGNAYLVKHGVTPKEKSAAPVDDVRMARFWSPRRTHSLPTGNPENRGDVVFKDWIFETPTDSHEAEWCRLDEIRDRLGIRELLSKPYEDIDVSVEFTQWLLSLMYTGITRSDGPSQEGALSVRAMLTEAELATLTGVQKNSPEELAKAVRKRKSMNVNAFNTEG